MRCAPRAPMTSAHCMPQLARTASFQTRPTPCSSRGSRPSRLRSLSARRATTGAHCSWLSGLTASSRRLRILFSSTACRRQPASCGDSRSESALPRVWGAHQQTRCLPLRPILPPVPAAGARLWPWGCSSTVLRRHVGSCRPLARRDRRETSTPSRRGRRPSHHRCPHARGPNRPLRGSHPTTRAQTREAPWAPRPDRTMRAGARAASSAPRPRARRQLLSQQKPRTPRRRRVGPLVAGGALATVLRPPGRFLPSARSPSASARSRQSRFSRRRCACGPSPTSRAIPSSRPSPCASLGCARRRPLQRRRGPTACRCRPRSRPSSASAASSSRAHCRTRWRLPSPLRGTRPLWAAQFSSLALRAQRRPPSSSSQRPAGRPRRAAPWAALRVSRRQSWLWGRVQAARRPRLLLHPLSLCQAASPPERCLRLQFPR